MIRFLSRTTSRTSMVMLVAIPSLLLTAALVGHDVLVSQRQLSEEGIRYGQFVTETIRSSAQRAVLQGSIAPVQEEMEAAGRSGVVQHPVLVGGDGRIVASDRRDGTGRAERILGEAENRELTAAALTSRQLRHRLADGGRRLVLASPLWLGGPNATEGDRALLYVEIDLESRRRDLSIALLKRGSISALASLGLNLFVVLSMREIIERRIRGASRDARAAARGEAVPPRRVGWPREIAWLIQDVGRLGSELRDKAAALEAAKEQLVEAQRMASVAHRTHAMAHDLNNQLTGILGYARLLLDRVGPGDPILRQLAIIETCATRAADLTGGLLIFGPPEPADIGASRPPGFDPAGAGPPAARVDNTARESRADAARPATILAVDDESTVLALAKDVLEMHGHNVLTARNGEEALRVFRARREEIDLVLLDLMMPVMGGRDCFRELRRIDPGVRVVISSGFSSESSASELLGEGALGYLQKPYDIDLLARTIIGALDRPEPAAAARAAG